MNQPKRLNGWTLELMEALKQAFREAADDPQVKVLILTGTDPYYSAGVNLGGTIRLSHPRKLRQMIIDHNQALFDTFLDFPKPILAAVNGPAIGATVTSGTLCDAIIASEMATFSTPFAKLGIPKEGCSSVLFERIMGEKNATRMLEKEGWSPTGAEAKDIGLAQWCVPHERLLEEARDIAKSWCEQKRVRTFRGSSTKEELKKVNAAESVALGNAFLDIPFLDNQFRFLWKKKKRVPALMFFAFKLSRPLWAKLF
ncbi:MAG: enoyl-CoA hydratase/isomerase family protein [Myxococcota bacterium]|jgi:enoyl-CoA hydratase/carnithine racemase|nr:enoyl-CoA hydratase/isomerase family protein [Myxococcota bacterium]